MSIENQFDRIATALEGIATRIDALGAAMNGGTTATTTTGPTFVQGTDTSAAILAEAAPLKEALAAATPAELVQAATATLAPDAKKRGRPALKAVSTAPEPDAAPVVGDAPAPLAPEPATDEDVKTAILAFAGRHGKQAALAILERHGAARVRDLDPATYGAVLADIAKG